MAYLSKLKQHMGQTYNSFYFLPDMFCNFYIVKNHKIANNSATIEAREKISTYLESL
jgi:hypothetical protein